MLRTITPRPPGPSSISAPSRVRTECLLFACSLPKPLPLPRWTRASPSGCRPRPGTRADQPTLPSFAISLGARTVRRSSFGASSKGNVYQEAGLDSERRFRKSQSFNSAGRHFAGSGSNPRPSDGHDSEQPLPPFDYPSPSVSAASSSASESGWSPPSSPGAPTGGRSSGGAPLEPAIQLGPPLFPAELFARPLAAPGPSSISIDVLEPSTGRLPVRSKPRKDDYDFATLPTPLLRTTSSTHALPLRRPIDPRAAEEARWQAAMAKGFDQVASGKVDVDLRCAAASSNSVAQKAPVALLTCFRCARCLWSLARTSSRSCR